MNLRVMKVNDFFTPNSIREDIWEHINKARILVADITDRNPNVFYELGLAHTIGKSVILRTQDMKDVPFNLQLYPVFNYPDNDV